MGWVGDACPTDAQLSVDQHRDAEQDDPDDDEGERQNVLLRRSSRGGQHQVHRGDEADDGQCGRRLEVPALFPHVAPQHQDRDVDHREDREQQQRRGATEDRDRISRWRTPTRRRSGRTR